jgi:hypothetical protein
VHLRGRLLVGLATLASLAAARPASSPAAPDRWRLSQADAVPLVYFQGLTHDADRSWFFDGVTQGLYRTDRHLRQQAANPLVLPADPGALGFNHIGDPTWDAREGGRLLLPLECFVPGAPNGGNTCGRGAIGVADPATLQMRYVVGLDPADIPKAMWAEVSPDGRLLWTSSGDDLIAYRTAGVVAGRTAPPRPVRRLAGAVPPAGVTGAAFFRGRLLLAGQDGGVLQVWSVDLAHPRRPRLEIELPGVRAESEGLDVLSARGGVLHWLLSPFPPGGGAPTFGPAHSELLTFVPRADARLRVAVTSASRTDRTGRVRIAVRVLLRYAGAMHAVAGARVRAGSAAATTAADGRARLRVRAPRSGLLAVVATRQRLLPGRATLRVVAR